MSKEFLPYIYDEFTREHNTTESGVDGTGLGLGITRKLVLFINGDINVESMKE